MNKQKKFFTKRKILILINAICFIVLLVSYLLSINEATNWNTDDLYYLSKGFILLVGYLLVQCVFTSLSFIVYYLAIMAEALNGKYKEEVEDNKANKK